MIFRKIVLFILTVFFGSVSYGQFTEYNLRNVSLNYRRGYVSDQNKRNFNVFNEYIDGVEVTLSKIPNGSKEWHRIFNYPETGFSIMYFDLGNNDILGRFFSVSRFVDFNLYTGNRWDVDFRTALGASVVTRYFHPTENHKNTFFSRPVNFFFEFNLSADYRIVKEKDFYLSAGMALMHASNGTTRLPNNGISATNFFVGLAKKDLTTWEIEKRPLESDIKKWRIDVLPTFGLKEHWLWGGEKYKALSLSTDILYELNKKQLIGLGVGVFYDETLKAYSNHNLDPVETDKEATAGSIHISHHLNLHPFYIVFKTGRLLVNNGNFSEKGYNLLGLRYFVINNLYVAMYHKSHGLFLGDNMQWGIGYEF